MAIGARQRRQAVREATRTRVVEAAVPLLVRDGYLATTMSGLAAAGGVAVQTLYLHYGSKVAVLLAALASAGFGAPGDEPEPWCARLAAEPDGPTALRRHVRDVCAQVERLHPLATVLRGAAADPEPAALLTATRDAAFARHTAAVDELSERDGFTTRISVEQATDTLAALTAPETYALLVVDRGWSTADWAAWATRLSTLDLFPDAAGRAPADCMPPVQTGNRAG